MRSQNKNPKNNRGSSRRTRSSSGSSADIDSKLLQNFAGKMGNESLKGELNQRNGQRDQLLALIAERLQAMHSVQQIELDELKNRPKWFREVSKGINGFHLPQPTRWHEAAQLFKKAAQAMGRGDLSKGKQILEEALKKEEAAYESIPDMVRDRLNSSEKNQSNQADVVQWNGQEICSATTLPSEINIADKICNIRDIAERAPAIRRTTVHNWWDIEEEESGEAEQENAIETETEIEENLEEKEIYIPQKDTE